ncbi:MAG: hypothetical protein KAR56_01915, partial [Thermoplasmata archaeon]|nr:hypothetical protein [Thermoplasmata archaeon]
MGLRDKAKKSLEDKVNDKLTVEEPKPEPEIEQAPRDELPEETLPTASPEVREKPTPGPDFSEIKKSIAKMKDLEVSEKELKKKLGEAEGQRDSNADKV